MFFSRLQVPLFGMFLPRLQVPLFDMLSQQQKNMICDGVQVTVFQPGAVVAQRGHAADSLIIVKTGQLESADGVVYKPGDHFGTPCLLAATSRDQTVTATGSGAAVCIEVKRGRIDLLDVEDDDHVVRTTSASSVKFATALQELYFYHIINEAFKASTTFANVDKSQLKALSSHVQLYTVEKSGGPQILNLEPGLELTRLFIVLEGRVKVTTQEGGDPIVLAEGGIYGEEHILDPRKPFTATVQMSDRRTFATIGTFPTEAFQSIQLGDEDFNARLAILKKVTIFR